MTTIVSVRRGNQVALAGDGQVSLGNTVMKGNASKVRRLYRGKVLAGFAGGTADAFTLFERFEAQLALPHRLAAHTRRDGVLVGVGVGCCGGGRRWCGEGRGA